MSDVGGVRPDSESAGAGHGPQALALSSLHSPRFIWRWHRGAIVGDNYSTVSYYVYDTAFCYLVVWSRQSRNAYWSKAVHSVYLQETKLYARRLNKKHERLERDGEATRG